MKAEEIIKGVVLSEKSVGLSDINQFALKVDLKATKADVKRVLSEVFDVDVQSVNSLVSHSEPKRRMRSKGSSSVVTTKKANVKKVYVKLKQGQSLPLPMLTASEE